MEKPRLSVVLGNATESLGRRKRRIMGTDDRDKEPGWPAARTDLNAAPGVPDSESTVKPETPEPPVATEPKAEGPASGTDEESREVGILAGVEAALNGTAKYRTHTDNLRAEFVARSESFKVHMAELEAKKASRRAQLEADRAARKALFDQEIARLEEQAQQDFDAIDGELHNIDHADRVLQASLKHL